jgi:hypothetical protein
MNEDNTPAPQPTTPNQPAAPTPPPQNMGGQTNVPAPTAPAQPQPAPQPNMDTQNANSTVPTQPTTNVAEVSTPIASQPQAPQSTSTPPVQPAGNSFQSFSQMNSGKRGAPKLLIITILLMIILVGGGIGAYSVVKNSTSDSKSSSSKNSSKDDKDSEDDKASTADTDKSDSDDEKSTDDTSATGGSTQESLLRDAKRKADINAIYQKLEEYYNENAGYPDGTLSASILLGIDSESLIDTDGKSVGYTGGFLTSTTAPTISPSDESEYIYAAYGCESDGAQSPTGATCTKYVLGTYAENEPGNIYKKSSLN